MRLAVLALVGTLGCSMSFESRTTTLPRAMKSPRGAQTPVFVCGRPGPTITEQVAVGFVAAALLGGVTFGAYRVIGGEFP